MSLSAAAFHFTFPDSKPDPTLTFPSPPASSAASDSGALEFDLDSFTHRSPGSTTLFSDDVTFGVHHADLSPITSLASPTSTTLISPKSSISLADVGPLAPLSSSSSEAEALSNHHLQRFLHYKALAAQAEAEARAAIQQNESFDALLAAYSMPDPSHPFKEDINMLAYQTQPQQQQPFYGVGNQGFAFAYQPQQAASMHHAQAQAHLQAHDAAVRAVQQPRHSLPGYYIPSSARSPFDVAPPQQLWSRGSISSQSGASPPFPSTPTYSGQPMMAPMMTKSSSASSMSMSVPRPIQPPSLPVSEGENEMDDELDEEDEDDHSGAVNGMPMTNLHGGGRGYVPGKTPDDPKKRHKCQICGRGFARAFNLKSHIQTHNPLRPKPHQCPHPTCKRGFSRLHDLERHRQGIHSDGPLVEAKRQGVAPSVARAQGRMQRRAESGGLI